MVIRDRGGAVVNRTLGAVLGDEDRVICQSHDPAFAQRSGCRVLCWLTALFVDDTENAVKGPSLGFLVGPARLGTQPRGSRKLHGLRHRS